MIISGTTQSGFEFEVDNRVFEDWRFVKAAASLSNGEAASAMSGAVTLAELVLGSSMSKLEEHLSAINDGFVPAKAVVDEINEITAIATKKDKNGKN